MKRLALLLVLTACCAAPVDVSEQVAPSEAGHASEVKPEPIVVVDEPLPPLDPNDIPAPYDPEVEDDGVSAMSEYQRSLALFFEPKFRRRINGVLLARWCISENSKPLRKHKGWKGDRAKRDGTAGVLTEDCFAQAQTVYFFRRWFNEQNNASISERDALRMLGPHATGKKPPIVCGPNRRHCPGDRQRWTSTLRERGSEQPSGWVQCTHWETNDKGKRVAKPDRCSGDWRVARQFWPDARAAAIDIVMDGFQPPCDGEPIAQGGTMDDCIAWRRGLCRLDCGDLNHFWAEPGKGCQRDDEANTIIDLDVVCADTVSARVAGKVR